MAEFVPVVGSTLDLVVTAFREGKGIPYAAYKIHDMQAGFTRPLFVNLLAAEWIPGIPELHARLMSESPARVVEIGCGEGVAAVALAQAFPNIRVDGIDLDGKSQEAPRSVSSVDERVPMRSANCQATRRDVLR